MGHNIRGIRIAEYVVQFGGVIVKKGLPEKNESLWLAPGYLKKEEPS